MYKARIADNIYSIETGKHASLDLQSIHFRFYKLEDGGYTLHLNGKDWIADLVKIDYPNKQITLRIEGKKYIVSVSEPVDIFLEKAGIPPPKPKKLNQLKAPMPGLVAKIMVKPGDQIKTGEPLLILEAMKMENVFKAVSDVVIKSVNVNEKQAVEKGQELISFV
ncbi:MAG: acetyl-CoA carboxylase biotin carboxyl carrier protein subunit [Chitinophagaceae bacterium]|nr:acetyl-CoA carboxylase biotin carboxyl carrier protein subunit [Chitinophagaceae bacterium]